MNGNVKTKVQIVGVGPGDPDLMTLRGAQLLAGATLVVYAGSLVNKGVLNHCSQDCRLIDSAAIALEEQVALMAAEARGGGRVVRLHTGDPSLYGAIGEQMRLLAGHGIECEITPGVSSLQGAAARLGIEYTIPGGTQTLICSRVSGRTPTPPAEDVESLARHGSTLVYFLSASLAEEIVSGCLAAGRSEDEPAAWIYQATWPDERSCRTTIGRLAASLKESGITGHALVVIGDCLLPGDARSLLYDPSFSHGYRTTEKGE